MQYLPNDWKLARVTPIYMCKGEVSAETNYRPISVISHVAKIFEKEVHTQVLLYLERHAFIFSQPIRRGIRLSHAYIES